MYRLRDHGRDAQGVVDGWGLNSRLDNLQAAILKTKLRDYDSDVKRRREIAAQYQESLAELPQLILPPPPSEDSDHFDIYQNYEIEAQDRDKLQAHLKSVGVGTLVQWGGKLVHQLDGLGLKAHLPFAENMIARSLMLPMNVSLTESDVEYVAASVQSFFAQGTSSYAA